MAIGVAIISAIGAIVGGGISIDKKNKEALIQDKAIRAQRALARDQKLSDVLGYVAVTKQNEAEMLKWVTVAAVAAFVLVLMIILFRKK